MQGRTYTATLLLHATSPRPSYIAVVAHEHALHEGLDVQLEHLQPCILQVDLFQVDVPRRNSLVPGVQSAVLKPSFNLKSFSLEIHNS